MVHAARAGISLQMHDGTIPGSMIFIPLDDHAPPVIAEGLQENEINTNI